MKQGLGTQLRHLIELLDGAVEASYVQAGLDYRPRYTPIMRALIAQAPLTIGQIVAHTGLSQPAATQTVALMIKQGLVTSAAGKLDARQRLVQLSELGRSMVPHLQRCWLATAAAAASLDADLPYPLSAVLAAAVEALEEHGFGERIQVARDASVGGNPGTLEAMAAAKAPADAAEQASKARAKPKNDKT
ncbi:MarR family winged helix-turn-helix transcriptional regulator [Massilia sp. S19_KUP03_FR1]|uniref:MarR family winged helix-turn-helix transcriptional regulator n=1 Tax=Massilia sp. S19_KUP03_FR1 TaxID=3025503 RepID=UPI002FCD8BF9